MDGGQWQGFKGLLGFAVFSAGVAETLEKHGKTWWLTLSNSPYFSLSASSLDYILSVLEMSSELSLAFDAKVRP